MNSWFWVTLILGQVLVVNSSTSTYRTLGLMPAVTILAGFALVRLAEALFHWWRWIKRLVPVVFMVLMLVFEGSWNIWNYFGIWAPQYRYSDPTSRMASLVGDFMGQQPPGTQVYFAPWPAFITRKWSAIEYKRGATPYQEIKKPVVDEIPNIQLTGPAAFIFPTKRAAELPALMQAFPGGKIVKGYLGDTLYYTAYIR